MLYIVVGIIGGVFGFMIASWISVSSKDEIVGQLFEQNEKLRDQLEELKKKYGKLQ